MKRLHTQSQNFLRSPKLVQELVRRSTLTSDDLVLDIGAGSGVITAVLAAHAKQVLAVEFDPRIAETLRRNVASYSNVQVRIGDILTMPLPRTPYKVFANIPFHLSSPLVQYVFLNPKQPAPQAAYLIVQKQFGRKLVSSDANAFTSQLGMSLGVEYSVKVLKTLRKTDFWPHPAVDTVCIELTRRPAPLIEPSRLAAYRRYTQECFSDPRKLAVLPLERIGAQPGLSPSRLSLERWVLLFTQQSIY